MSSYSIGMGEGKVVREPSAVLVAPGLGSCVALTLHSRAPVVAALAHIMLPASPGDGAAPYKFADTAVPLLVRQFEEAGGAARKATIKIAGGAQMFRVPDDSPLSIGRRNVEAIVAALGALGLAPAARDVGGHVGRTVRIEVVSGRVLVRTVGGAEQEL